ncbi:hypothetical protein GCM10011400_21450 [Paraburkholderia caffeinilytica]|uniref:Uncharacterized protein n=1 Tax=Paraburkholderia caffeinilytica TaxID=1761016 RepID=A0ABQ1MB75_9BURK|nr:hypothetical protein GCM10011400_21450 [Paraburkholderia caffeinilytica]
MDATPMLVIKNVRREDFMGTHSIYIELIAVLMTAVPKDSNEAVARDGPNDRDKRIGTTSRACYAHGMPAERMT